MPLENQILGIFYCNVSERLQKSFLIEFSEMKREIILFLSFYSMARILPVYIHITKKKSK